MLEIASEIIVCLLIAATIGAAIGYLICKSLSEKTQSASTTPDAEEKPAEEKNEIVTETLIEEPSEVSQDVPKEDTDIENKTIDEEVEISTENAIEKALEALEEIDLQEDETPEVEDKLDKKPELLSSPRNGEKDDLTQIKGIGPKLEEKLNHAGIYHFDQIANWTETNFEWLTENTTFASRAKKDAWVSQSRSFI